MKKVLSMALIAPVFIVGFSSFTPKTQAAPFLCLVIGDGELNADAHNGGNGVGAITPAVGTSLLLGNNQAGAHAKTNAHNTDG